MADIWYLDYSAAKLSGTTIKNAGYKGTIRYIAAGRESKQTDLAEYRSHIAAGLDVWLVCQAGTEDADQGYIRGAELARAAKAEADGLGYPSNRVIFFTNDRVELPNPPVWRAFLTGAASVLGRNRVGAYGFGNAMDAAREHAVAFWQAGRRSELRSFVNFWQDNNVQVQVGGITCDRNLLLKPIQVESDMDARDVWGYKNLDADPQDAFAILRRAAWNYKNVSVDSRDVYGILVGAAGDAEAALSAAKGAVSAANAARAEAANTNAYVDTLGAKLDGLASKVDQLQLGGVDVNALAAALAPAVADVLAKRLES